MLLELRIGVAAIKRSPMRSATPGDSKQPLQLRLQRFALIAKTRDHRSQGGDYATGVFYPEKPVREIAGRAQGKPQRFALEFFILFEGEERGQQAKFKATYGPADESWRATKTLTATVPMDAHAAPANVETQ